MVASGDGYRCRRLVGGLCSQRLAEHKTTPRSFIRIVSIIHSENRLTFTHKGNIIGGTRGREFVVESSSMARGIKVKGQRAIEGVPTSLSETLKPGRRHIGKQAVRISDFNVSIIIGCTASALSPITAYLGFGVSGPPAKLVRRLARSRSGSLISKLAHAH